jgi:hypothetical protein
LSTKEPSKVAHIGNTLVSK